MKWAGGFGGIVGFFSFFLSYVDRETEQLHARMIERDKLVRQYIDVHNSNIIERLEDINDTLIRIDDRVYKIHERTSKLEGGR